MSTVEETLVRLSHSSFRSRFHLSEKDKAYVAERGMAVIRRHAEDFVHERLSPAVIPNDGKQTPMRGHPVFKAQHACACCCRECLYKWYKVKKGTKLSAVQEAKIVGLLMAWIEKEMERQ